MEKLDTNIVLLATYVFSMSLIHSTTVWCRIYCYSVGPLTMKFLYKTNTKTEHRRLVSRSCKAHYDPLKSVGEMKRNTKVNFCSRRSHIVNIRHSSHAWRRQVLVSCDVCLCLCCLLLSGSGCEWSLQTCLQFCSSCCREESTHLWRWVVWSVFFLTEPWMEYAILVTLSPSPPLSVVFNAVS